MQRIPTDLQEKFEFHNYGHALEILSISEMSQKSCCLESESRERTIEHCSREDHRSIFCGR